MNFWGFTVETQLEWLLLIVFLSLLLGVYLSLVWFIQKYTTGMLGGFILLLAGFFLTMVPTYDLLTTFTSFSESIGTLFIIAGGGITLIVGAFKLYNFSDF